MGAGGIVNQRAAALLTAAQDSSLYDGLPSASKTTVDAVAAKDPTTRDIHDCENLLKVLKVAIHC
jgi:hypothetical protein